MFKIFIKKNYPLLIVMFIILLYSITFMNYYVSRINYIYDTTDSQYREICNEYYNSDEDAKKEMSKNYGYDINELCDLIVNKNLKDKSFQLYYNYFINNMSFISNFFLLLIIVIVPLIYVIRKEFNSGYIKNYLQRKSYKSYIFRIYRKSYVFMILPLLIILMCIIKSCYESGFNFNPGVDLVLGNLSEGIFDNTLSFIAHFFSIIFVLGFIINIVLIILSVDKNFIKALIKSFILILFITIFLFIVVGLFLQSKFNLSAENFFMLDLYKLSDITSYKVSLIFNFICYIVSLIVSIYFYKNKEKTIMFCEDKYI